MTYSNEAAYQAIAAEITSFVGARYWESAGGKYDVLRRSVGSTWWREIDGVRDQRGAFPDRSISDLATHAIRAIRDHILETTGQRIWGLTFTLYPDGKFNIEYDYERPADYTEEDEAADIAAEQADVQTAEADTLALRLNSLGVNAQATVPTDFESAKFFNDALAWLRHATHEQGKERGLGTENAWNLDMEAGTLRLGFDDGRQVLFDVQVIGTWNSSDGSFLWGWDHPSIPEPLRHAAHKLHEYGQTHDIGTLTTRKVTCTENDAWAFVAAAARLDNADGAYRGQAGNAWVYMSFKQPASPKQTGLLGKLFGH